MKKPAKKPAKGFKSPQQDDRLSRPTPHGGATTTRGREG